MNCAKYFKSVKCEMLDKLFVRRCFMTLLSEIQSLIITVGHIVLHWVSSNDYREKRWKVPGFFHLHFFHPASKNFDASNQGGIVYSFSQNKYFSVCNKLHF